MAERGVKPTTSSSWHDQDELAHYAKCGAGTYDVEYRYPFSGGDGFGELGGHRAPLKLRPHPTSRAQPHEALTSRTTLASAPARHRARQRSHSGRTVLLCEAYDVDESRPSPELMRFHPQMAPIKAAVFPLVNKDGMPEIAEKLYMRSAHDTSLSST